MVLMACLKKLRHSVAGRDGSFDDDEITWELTASENQVESGGLVVSFLSIQVLRCFIGGVLPNAEGVEVPQATHPPDQVHLMAWSSVGVMLLLTILFLLGFFEVEESE